MYESFYKLSIYLYFKDVNQLHLYKITKRYYFPLFIEIVTLSFTFPFRVFENSFLLPDY